MTWHKLGQFKVGPQNLHELHVSNVYKDAEFIEDVEIIFPGRNRLLELEQQNPNDATIEKQIIDGVRAVDSSERERLAEKYSITIDDVAWYLRGYNQRTGEFHRAKKKPFKAMGRGDGTITIEFHADVTKEDYLEAWNHWVVPLKGKATQPKLPVHDKLLYAIFKAREQRGETFKQIFEQYEKGTLPNYSDSNKMFASNQKKLEEYYRKYTHQLQK